MPHPPLISVIVPVYNGELYVKECIENILNQTYKSIEIIVIDDGSSDHSAAIAQSYPIRLIQFPKNKGLSAARNAGIDAATGEYIHFYDVDDTVNNCFYENMANAIVETGADIACGGIVNEAKPHRTMRIDTQLVITDTQEKLKKTNVGRWGYSVRYLFKKEFLNKNSLRFEEGRFIEDMPFSLAAVYFSNKIVFVPNAVYTYIKREGSIMTKRDKSHVKKRHQDYNHAKEVRHYFARKHGFKIPGVPTGRFGLFFVKWFT